MFFDFDVMDAVDVEEVVLVVVGDQPFHLGRVHAAVGLGDVDDRQVQAGEDVDLHAVEGQTAAAARATMATMMVIGRRRAKSIGFIGYSRHSTDGFSSEGRSPRGCPGRPTRMHPVEDDAVEGLAGRKPRSVASRGGGLDLEAGRSQALVQAAKNSRFILEDKVSRHDLLRRRIDGWCHGARSRGTSSSPRFPRLLAWKTIITGIYPTGWPRILKH